FNRFLRFLTGTVAPFLQRHKDDFLAVGEAIKDELTPALKAVGSFIKGTVVPAFISMGKFVAEHREIFKLAAVAILGAVAALKALSIIKGIISSFQLFNAVLLANPIGLVVAALGALVAGLVYAWQNSETFRSVVTAVWNGIKAVILAVWTWL